MNNEVTKELLDESLASIQDYLDSISAEQFEKDYLEIREFTEGGIPAAEIIGWEPEEYFLELVDADLHQATIIPREVFDRVEAIKEKVKVAKEKQGE